MNVLMINKFLFENGGSEIHLFALASLLQSHGHKIAFWGMDHPLNSVDSLFPVKQINFENAGLIEKLKFLFTISHSFEARKKMTQVINENKNFEIAHIHNFHHQLTTSILEPLARNMPVVQTLHDYKLICPNYLLYRKKENMICEVCLSGKYFHAIPRRCHKNSLLKSMAVALQSYLDLITKRLDYISHFISPSEFLKNKMIESGFGEERITVVRNFPQKSLTCLPLKKSENYFIYFGRVVEEKGVEVLLQAFSNLQCEAALKIVGNGPDRQSLMEKYPSKDIQFIEHLPQKELFPLIQGAIAAVFPARWHENCPMAILESLALGVPVIASRMGGIPELIINNYNGLLFDSGSLEHLEDALQTLLSDRKLRDELAQNSRKRILEECNEEVYYTSLMDVYRKVI